MTANYTRITTAFCKWTISTLIFTSSLQQTRAVRACTTSSKHLELSQFFRVSASNVGHVIHHMIICPPGLCNLVMWLHTWHITWSIHVSQFTQVLSTHISARLFLVKRCLHKPQQLSAQESSHYISRLTRPGRLVIYFTAFIIHRISYHSVALFLIGWTTDTCTNIYVVRALM
jgi:hypothetical protein